ncbi:MAG: hypothetical protein CVU08_09760 [Bacteroidetes bacterium HGW-Bacteroidetes-3]|nr:MAG: hypothetical protein CVU08_09760 [Bacteroidetes bacterium HGW-Bacteroidetes-3]
MNCFTSAPLSDLTFSFGLPTSVFGLPSPVFRLPSSVFRLPTSVFGLPTSVYILFSICFTILSFQGVKSPANICFLASRTNHK